MKSVKESPGGIPAKIPDTESIRKSRKRDRIISLFKRRDERDRFGLDQTGLDQSSGLILRPCSPSDTTGGDNEKTRMRYLRATKQLEDAINGCEGAWGSFDFPELSGEPEDFGDSLFRGKIDTIMNAQKTNINDHTAWEKCRQAAQYAFTAFSPFAKCFLSIAKEGQAIADKEIARKEELGKSLEYLSHQFAFLEIVKALPDDMDHREFVVNRALDVRSASMIYLASMVRHNATAFGTTGKVVKTLFLGDKEITDSKAYLDNCVDNYSRALTEIVGVRIVIKVWEMMKGLAALNPESQNVESGQTEEIFLVPYRSNPRFIGREKFLQVMKDKLSDTAPKHNNHCIALYGMGGIGKTQCALGYVYANRDSYDRVYWVRASNETSLLSGFQSIAKAARLHYLRNTTPVETAKAVLSWMRQERSWLLVIDNLDDIIVANGFLPENGAQKHTIITTRDPNTAGIPAEPLEVPLLDIGESINLLSALSEIIIEPGSSEEGQASEIVQKLGYLPLAIEQAAAYVREVTADFSVYLDEYQQNHKTLHEWVPAGNRQYDYSIAKTWSMSFNRLQKYSAKLLQLFAYLSPEGILIEFLIVGAEAVEDDLKHTITDRIKLATALLELEKFSLIKWDRKNKSITIHRLLQMVITDEISEDDSRSTVANVLNIFNHAFPNSITNETHILCRKYQGQIVEPLLRMNAIRNSKAALVGRVVGEFLLEDAKYIDSEKLLLQAVEIYKSMFGTENPETLLAMHKLGLVYHHQERLVEAAKIQAEVLEKRQRLLGDKHPDTLRAMINMGSTYCSQGRIGDAIRVFEQIIDDGKRDLGAGHIVTLKAMLNLGRAYVFQGRKSDAIPIFEEILEKGGRTLEKEHTDLLTTSTNLAMCYALQKREADAYEIMDNVIETRNRILGEEHPLTLNSLGMLAAIYGIQGRKAEAASLMEEVLQKKRRIFGEDHPETIKSMNALAGLYYSLEQNSNAVSIQEDVVRKANKIFGEEHPDTLKAMFTLYVLYNTEERDADALRIFTKIIDIVKRIFGEEEPDENKLMDMIGLSFLRSIEDSQ